MKISGIIYIVSILAVSFSSMSYAGNSKWVEAKTNDNISMMEYAEKNHERLSDKAVNVNIDPDFSSWASLWTYKMPDGAIVRCKRGVISYTFVYRCTEN